MQLHAAVGDLPQQLVDGLAALLHLLELVDLVEGEDVDHLLELPVLHQDLEDVELVPLPSGVSEVYGLLVAFLGELARLGAFGRDQGAPEQVGA